MYAQLIEGAGHFQLVLHGEGDALELRTVAQRGVEDLDRIGPRRIVAGRAVHRWYFGLVLRRSGRLIR